MISNFPDGLNFNPVTSQTQPVHLELYLAFSSPHSLFLWHLIFLSLESTLFNLFLCGTIKYGSFQTHVLWFEWLIAKLVK